MTDRQKDEGARKKKRSVTVEARIYRALFAGQHSLAMTRRIWPNPRPDILAAIKKALVPRVK